MNVAITFVKLVPKGTVTATVLFAVLIVPATPARVNDVISHAVFGAIVTVTV